MVAEEKQLLNSIKVITESFEYALKTVVQPKSIAATEVDKNAPW